MRDEDFAGLVAGLEASGHTRTEIARAAGISRATVWRIATGNAREPGAHTIERLRRLERNFSPGVSPPKQKTG